MTESSARCRRLCERNATENGAAPAVDLVADLTTLETGYDTVAYAPKPYTPVALVNQRLVDALSRLQRDGVLYVAAAEHAGLERYRDCLRDVSPAVATVATRGDVELLRATRPERIDRPTYVSPRTIQPIVDGVELRLVTIPGVFAASGLDHGTRLLLETVDVADGERVLDVCCGYGPLGIYAATTADCRVCLSDDDRVATRCAACSLDASDIEATVVTADCTRGVADRTFDRVLCNPPTHAGRGVLTELFAGIYDVLAADGVLQLVHHERLDLDRYLQDFDAVSQQASGTEHVVLRAERYPEGKQR